MTSQVLMVGSSPKEATLPIIETRAPRTHPAEDTSCSLHQGSTPGFDSDDDDSHSIGGQRNVFSTRHLLVAFPALSIALFVSFLDQTTVSTAVPAISSDLNTGTATSWIGASFLIAATAFQLINGRLSDIFGRKNLLLICLGLLAGGDLVCGFARSKEQLFAFRALAGIGGGGVNSIAMIIVSDITTLENRGKFQGILGAVIAMANGVGPFIGGAVVEKATWRWVFWMIPMAAVPAGLVILFFLPLKHNAGNHKEKLKMIDYGGILLNIGGCLMILVPLSGGGISYAWDSPMVISMMVLGGALWVGFCLYEWKLAKVPILPMRLFKAPHCAALYAQSFMTGSCFYGNFFYLPIYFQSALGQSAMTAGAMILPVVITTSVSSIISGQLLARFGRYMPFVVVGFALWSLATGLKCIFNRDTSTGEIIGILILEGFGIGFTLQPTLIGLLANSKEEDRAVLTGLRNFLRTIGGASGLTISGTILSNTLRTQLSKQDFATDELVGKLVSSTYSIQDQGLSDDQTRLILQAYMRGLHYVFIYYAVSAGVAFLLSGFIGNTDIKGRSKQKDHETESGQESQEEEARAPTRSEKV